MNLALQLSEIEKQVSSLISENLDLKKENSRLKADYKSLYELREEENKGISGKIAELEMLVQKLKCCENCKHHSFWGDELKCNLINYDDEFECLKTKSKWELWEKEQ